VPMQVKSFDAATVLSLPQPLLGAACGLQATAHHSRFALPDARRSQSADGNSQRLVGGPACRTARGGWDSAREKRSDRSRRRRCQVERAVHVRRVEFSSRGGLLRARRLPVYAISGRDSPGAALSRAVRRSIAGTAIGCATPHSQRSKLAG